MASVQAVLFDMDGVLVDSEPHWQQFWQEEIFPHTQDGTPTLADVTGRNFRENIVDIDDEHGLPGGHEPFERELEVFGENLYDGDLTVTEGMPALFEAIRDYNVPLGIVSSSPAAWIRRVVEHSALGPVDIIVSAEDIDEPGKPAPDVYEHAADRTGANPDRCLVIEDSENGVRAASRAEATVIRFRCNHAVESLPEADAVAEDVEDLREIVTEWIGLTSSEA